MNLLLARHVTTVLLAILVVTATVPPAAAASCDPADLARWEAERETAVDHLARIESRIDSLRTVLGTLADRIAAEQAAEQAGRGKRGHLEQLLQTSRSTATEMDRLVAERVTVETAADRLGAALRDCYGPALLDALGRMTAAVRNRRYEQAARDLKLVQELELKLQAIERAVPDRSYPVFSEDFIRSALTSFDERAFLLDTMTDLLERAERDSATSAATLVEVRKSISLKEDLVRLIEASARGGTDGATFFDEFRGANVAREIETLHETAAQLSASLANAVEAVRYYRDRIEFLNQLVGKDGS